MAAKVMDKAVCVISERGQLSLHDAIEIDGQIILVVLWLVNFDAGRRKPGLVLPLSSVEHQDLRDQPKAPWQFFVTSALPEQLFLGTASPEQLNKHSVLPGPNLDFELGHIRPN